MSKHTPREMTETILRTIVEAQSLLVDTNEWHQCFDLVLQNLLSLTNSQYGFIAEVLTNDEGQPFLKTQAVSDVAWNAATRNLYGRSASNVECAHSETFFGRVMTSEKPAISNHPGRDIRVGELPDGPPTLNSLLGLPLHHGSKLVGMAGIANCPGGYDESLVTPLQALLTFCGSVIEAKHKQQQKLQAERAHRERVERFSLLLDGAKAGVWDWNIRTGHVRYSERFLTSLGYEPDTIPPSIGFLESLVHADDWAKVKTALSEHFAGNTEGFECETRFRMDSGEWRWSLDRGRMVELDRSGKPLRMVGIDIDISKRITAEEKDFTLQCVLERGKEGVALIDETGHFTYMNASHARQYGYEVGELIGRPWKDLFQDDQITYLNEVCFPILNSRGWWNGELKGKKKKGETVEVEIYLALCRDSNTQSQRILCTCRDITARKKLEINRRTSEQAIREMLEITSCRQGSWVDRVPAILEMGCRRFNLPIGVMTRLQNGKVRFEAVHALQDEVKAGQEYPVDQIFCGRTLEALRPLSIHGAGKTQWKSHPGYRLLGWEAYLGAPIFVGEELFGTIAFAAKIPRKERIGNAERDFIQLIAQWIGKEISRWQSETSLKESEARFRHLADSAPVLIWMTDAHKHCMYVNQTWLAFTGHTLEGEQGHGWMEGIHPDDFKHCERVFLEAFKSGVPFAREFRLKNADGRFRWVLDRGVPRTSQDGRFLGYIGSCSDIHEQKLHQESIRQYNQLLKDEVDSQTRHIQELEKRRMQVEKLAALSQVAAGVAHEINNPLASIKQSFYLIKKLLPSTHPRLKYVNKIDEEIERIASIIKNMYQLYQPRPVNPQLLDLNNAAVKALETIHGLQSIPGVRVRKNLHKHLPPLPLPAIEIHQVLCNLLQNAWDALEGQGKITITTGMDQRCVWISIVDDGSGIPAEVLPFIFDPFFSTKGQNSRGGMGLGLSVSKSLVEAMGGVLEVNTKVEGITVFSIVFPLPVVPLYSGDDASVLASNQPVDPPLTVTDTQP